MSRGRNRKHTKLELMRQMRSVAAKVGRPPTSAEFNKYSEEGFSSNQIYSAWPDRSWPDVLELMEFGKDRIKRSRSVQASEESLIDNIWEVARVVGRPPMYEDMRNYGKHGPEIYKKMYDCDRWDDVLETFGMFKKPKKEQPPLHTGVKLA